MVTVCGTKDKPDVVTVTLQLEVGLEVGARVGNTVGTWVGWDDVGAIVVGCPVGAEVLGAKVGARVIGARVVGAAVGRDVVGALVGCAVPPVANQGTVHVRDTFVARSLPQTYTTHCESPFCEASDAHSRFQTRGHTTYSIRIVSTPKVDTTAQRRRRAPG